MLFSCVVCVLIMLRLVCLSWVSGVILLMLNCVGCCLSSWIGEGLLMLVLVLIG